ncbi:IclR family transcriptional regulator [Paradevosia shaoguanensis]|uniref:IclR family transcriptional regulator n=1 Tax=Paradevosia shaoguanensis TaxID=1335043 RepID=UPI00068BF52F|nr:IclR family transcriptional regulator [Paradevosia shaoguanensis]
MTVTKAKPSTNKSLAKAVRVLKLFSAQEPRLPLAEISARLDMPKSTTHAILRSLVAEGLIEKIGGEAYALGTGILALSQSVRVNVEIRDRAAPHVRALADKAGESVYFTFLEGDRILYIYAVESSRRLIARTAVGDRMPMHCTGVGKAILAHLPEAEVRSILERMGMPRVTPNTITDLEALISELGEIRARGYSFDNGENETGNYCVGAPVFGADGRVIGGCSISGTDPEIIASRAPEIARMLIAACLDMSRNLGYVPPSFSQLHSAVFP